MDGKRRIKEKKFRSEKQFILAHKIVPSRSERRCSVSSSVSSCRINPARSVLYQFVFCRLDSPMALNTCAKPIPSPPTHNFSHDLVECEQTVFPPALSAGANINETIRYSLAFSADFLVFVLADAGLNNFMTCNPVQNGKMETRSHDASGFEWWCFSMNDNDVFGCSADQFFGDKSVANKFAE